MRSKISLVLFLLVLFEQNSAINILGLFPAPAKSHNYWNMAVVKGLAAKGYNITVLTADPFKNMPSNVHILPLDTVYESAFSGPNSFDISDILKETPLSTPKTFHLWVTNVCRDLNNSIGFKLLNNYPNDFKFDLVLNDNLGGACMLGFLHKFNYPPMAGLLSLTVPPWIDDTLGGQISWAYSPIYYMVSSNEMNFWQRAFNTFLHLYEYWVRYSKTLPALDEFNRANFNYSDLPYAGDLERKMSLLLLAHHPAVNFPKLINPNVIPLGGLHVEDPQPLPKELEAFVSKGKKGSVLVSFGTIMRSDILGNATISAILRVFEQLPDYNFVFKFESKADSLPVKPTKNVLVTNWVPQNDLLAHPQTRAFVSHCGLMSVQEATWWGVPMVAAPCFADQPQNARHLVLSGSAVQIDPFGINEENFLQALLDVLENPSFQQKMKLRSSRFRDQPMRPRDAAVWWLEWLMRNPEPDHLRMPSVELGLIRRSLWDIYLAVIVAIATTLYASWRVLRILLSVFVKRKIENKLKRN